MNKHTDMTDMTDTFPSLLNYFSLLGWWWSIYNIWRIHHTAHAQKSSCWNCVRRNYGCRQRTRNRNTTWKGLMLTKDLSSQWNAPLMLLNKQASKRAWHEHLAQPPLFYNFWTPKIGPPQANTLPPLYPPSSCIGTFLTCKHPTNQASSGYVFSELLV